MPPRRTSVRPGQEYVVKCALKRALRHKALQVDINRWVDHASKIYHRGALFTNLHLLRILTEKRKDGPNGTDGSDIPLPDLEDQTFYNHCFLMGIGDQDDPDPDMQVSWDKYKDDLFPEGNDLGRNHRIEGDPQLISYLAKKYRTNLLNHLKVHFFKRQYKMILEVCRNDSQLARRVQSIINNFVPEDPTFSPGWQEFIREQKAFFNTAEPIIKIWVATHLHEVLRYTHDIQRKFKARNIRNFSIAPIARIRSHFITIDTKVLYFLSKKFHKGD